MGRRRKLTECDILKARLNNIMDEVLELLEAYDVEEYTYKDAMYDYLNEGDRVIVVKNPNGLHDLIIEKTEDVCLYFHAWYSRYYFTDNDFIELKSEIKEILENRHAAIIQEPFLQWTGMVLFKNDMSHLDETTLLCKTDLINGIDIDKRTMKGEIRVCYWNPENDFSFYMEELSKGLFEFPKRYVIRLIIQDGIVKGFSSFFKIRNSPICIAPPIPDNIFFDQVFTQLEIDIQRARGKHLYILSHKDQLDFYKEHGYCLTEDYPDINELLGKDIEFDGVFEKYIG